MLWTIFVILLVLWLLGVVSGYTVGGFHSYIACDSAGSAAYQHNRRSSDSRIGKLTLFALLDARHSVRGIAMESSGVFDIR